MNLMHLLISAGISAYEWCWVFGDDFVARSFERYFKTCPCTDYYIKTHFDSTGYFSKWSSDNPSIIGRFSNLMAQSVTGKSELSLGGQRLLPLPKIVIVVPDDDIIKALDIADICGLSKPIGRVLNFIMTDHEHAIAAFKDYLPSKSVKNDYPQILWIQPPLHDNFTNNSGRYKFNKCLEETTKFHSNVHALSLKKVWNPQDPELFSEGHYTASGYQAYWEAIDKTTRYFDSIVLKKADRKKHVKPC